MVIYKGERGGRAKMLEKEFYKVSFGTACLE